ncbi:MAG TPA: stage II sporulation protein M [Candidatus Saccharimonadales bacterium]|nr:stage II sporulation protein M [Candidatus Saccharimonadales bacterium]
MPANLSPKTIFLYYKKIIFEARFWFLSLGIIFLLGLFVGIIVSVTIPSLSTKILKSYSSSVNFNAEEGLSLSLFIFKKNLGIVTLGSFLGFFFGALPALVANLNGFLLGIVLGFGEIYSKVNPWQLFLLLFPHGIFEYAGTFLGLTFGFRWGLGWVVRKANVSRKAVFVNDLKELLAIFPLVVLLLGIAALIEGNLTGKIACILASACR